MFCFPTLLSLILLPSLFHCLNYQIFLSNLTKILLLSHNSNLCFLDSPWCFPFTHPLILSVYMIIPTTPVLLLTHLSFSFLYITYILLKSQNLTYFPIEYLWPGHFYIWPSIGLRNYCYCFSFCFFYHQCLYLYLYGC